MKAPNLPYSELEIGKTYWFSIRNKDTHGRHEGIGKLTRVSRSQPYGPESYSYNFEVETEEGWYNVGFNADIVMPIDKYIILRHVS